MLMLLTTQMKKGGIVFIATFRLLEDPTLLAMFLGTLVCQVFSKGLPKQISIPGQTSFAFFTIV
jgi:hypothetical protein